MNEIDVRRVRAAPANCYGWGVQGSRERLKTKLQLAKISLPYYIINKRILSEYTTRVTPYYSRCFSRYVLLVVAFYILTRHYHW